VIDLKNIPSDPGCYIYKDARGKIIYIGKAKSLKKRVKSYFQKNQLDQKTRHLVLEIASVDYFATSNEVEALILENNLIKKHKPKFNILLKDNTRYAFILLTDEEYPRLISARNQRVKGKYFGPYVSGQQRFQAVQTLTKTFGIRTCKKLPKRECLRYHIGLCTAPCINKISKTKYQKNTKLVERFLKGHTDEMIGEFKAQMTTAAKSQKYERAKSLRDQIGGLESLQQKQNVETDEKYHAHIINYIVDQEKVYLMIFEINKGILTTKNEFEFTNGINFLDEFISRYYSTREVPREIILPDLLKDSALLDYLKEIRKGAVTITVPKLGKKAKLLGLVKRNIEISFIPDNEVLTELKDTLRMNSTPYVIECFDISHLQGTNVVASMVQFRNGRPSKSNYRKYNIKHGLGNDDFASMHEVVTRRYKKLRDNKEQMPDLIVVDGGKGQLSSSQESLRKLGLKVPMISLAKREEEIFIPGRSSAILLKRSSKALTLLRSIRDEAHRFAITFQKKKRSMQLREEMRNL
jgi:excinuclease ABC subunit C